MSSIPVRLTLVALLALAVTGCGGDEGVEVHGSVTLGGKPLTMGSISISPIAAEGTAGPGANVPVVDGQFHVTDRLKMKPGAYAVRVNPPPLATLATKSPDGNLPPGVMAFKNYETKIEVKPGVPVTIEIPASYVMNF
jgi:hypothetical protein